MINQQTRLNMVIGHPLTHTQSPLLHKMLYQALTLNAVLLAFAHPQLPSLIQAIKVLAVELTAVTMPFKESILQYLDYCSPEAENLQAANTIIQRAGKFWGHNTDVDGIVYALRKTTLADKHVLIIGAGGAARALAYVLQKNRANLYWLNRSKKRALNLTKIFGGEVVERKHIRHIPFDILVNTTPLGMYPAIRASALPNYLFKPEQTVFDMVYNPLRTRLLKQAATQGAKIISGLEMFIGQGLRQVELWQQQPIPHAKKMLADIKKALSQGQS